MPRIASPFESLESRRLRAVDLQFTEGPHLVNDRGIAGEFVPVAGTAVLFNAGDTATGTAVAYRVVVASDLALTQDVTVLGSGTTAAPIAAGSDSEEISFSFAVPAGLLGTTRHLGLILDPENAIAETNETNNSKGGADDLRIATTLVGSTVTGTAGDDDFRVGKTGDAIFIQTLSGFNQIEQTQMARLSDLTGLIFNLGDGNDRLASNPYSGPDSFVLPLAVEGGAGNDTITTSGGNDTIDAGDGSDFILAGPGNDSVLGGAGRDTLDGAAGNDFVGGGAGNDTIQGGDGDDSLAGDGGNDKAYGDAGNDRVAGNGGSDNLFGGAGDDTVLGQNGRDYLRGGSGADHLLGGGGNDVLSVDLTNGDPIDFLNGNGGFDESIAPASALLSSIESMRLLNPVVIID